MIATSASGSSLPQRPGLRPLDPQPGRTLLDFAADLDRLADALGLDRFAVLGVSAGGPYAVACAHRLPDRVTAAAAVSSLSPLCAPAEVPGLPSGCAAAAGDREVAQVHREGRRHDRLRRRAPPLAAACAR